MPDGPAVFLNDPAALEFARKAREMCERLNAKFPLHSARLKRSIMLDKMGPICERAPNGENQAAILRRVVDEFWPETVI